MPKIYKHLSITRELKNHIAKNPESVTAKISLSAMNKIQTIKIHSWQNGDTEIKLNDIIYIHSSQGNCFVHLTGGTIIIHKRAISFYQKLLNEKLFIRVHQSYLINQLHMLGEAENNLPFLTMTNGEKIPVSVRYKKLNSEQIRVAIVSNN